MASQIFSEEFQVMYQTDSLEFLVLIIVNPYNALGHNTIDKSVNIILIQMFVISSVPCPKDSLLRTECERKRGTDGARERGRGCC